VIVPTSGLGELAGTTAMVDGGFDPLHPGHVDYFREAAELGAPVLCNVSSDDWVVRKHVPLLTQEERGALIDAIRYVAYTHLAQTTTADVLRVLRPRYYVKGSDWRGALPEDERAICSEAGVEIVFLDTVSLSSTAILERYAARQKPPSRTA
jgi:cytidyltransferase-like protein